MAQFLKNTDPRFHLIELRSKAFIALVFLAILSVAGFTIWKQEWFRNTKSYYIIANTSEGLQKHLDQGDQGYICQQWHWRQRRRFR